MSPSSHPSDRPDPNENMPAMRARVPDHVSRGVFSTGVIVMTGATEFILDFVQNLGRPHQVVARVVMPHVVMPQFADALSTNIDLYRQRFGALPTPVIPGSTGPNVSQSPNAPLQPVNDANQDPGKHGEAIQDAANHEAPVQPKTSMELNASSASSSSAGSAGGVGGMNSQLVGGFTEPPKPPAHDHHAPSQAGANPPPRRQTAQEVYDDLKLRDEILSGGYANAVMIGHGPHEFSFDFITNFYPQSAVSNRVFMASGQVGRLLESLRTAWEQLRPKNG